MTTGPVLAAPTHEGKVSSNWQELRADGDIQFEPVSIPPQPPREPGAFERFMQWLGEQIGEFGSLFGSSWWLVKWILLALMAAALLFLLYRLMEPYLRWRQKPIDPESQGEWQPDQQAAIALLEEADRLAAEGHFDAATHLLLQRSVSQIAAVRPDWVEPSSTARELASFRELPQGARAAFGVIAERVERSIFALRSLNRTDWDDARRAYADFALERIDGRQIDRVVP